MTEQPEYERPIAMLIDGDNAQHSLFKETIEEVSRYGKVTIRRAYGDWTQANLANWRSVMLTYAIHPMQQWRYTIGKNATDSSLIIDAMDILYSGAVQGFCIVSSDSDYTRLCTRIRESGLFVMGVGRKQTPEAFVKACDVFVYAENLAQNGKEQPKKVETEKSNGNKKGLLNMLQRAFDISVQDDGWVHLGALGNALHRLEPSFDSRTFGFKTLSQLVKSLPDHIIITTFTGAKDGGPSAIYVRMREE